MVVLVWKADSDVFSAYDMGFLTALTLAHPTVLGVAVTFDARKKDRLRAALLVNGAVLEDWLEVRR